jgi:penicillin-binding protein 2
MERMTRFRSNVLLVLVAIVLCFFVGKLYTMQVVDAAEKADNITTYTTITRVRAARGDLLDTHGNVLVSNRASYNLEFNHYVVLNSDNPNESLRQLTQLCKTLDIAYEDHFPVTKERPFTYTLGDYNSIWQGYFQDYLPTRGGLDSDITAPLLIKTLRESYKIPEDWTDEEARLVIGLRYELSLRQGNITNLPNFVLIEDVSDADRAAILELNIPGLNVEASTVREYSTKYAAHVLGYVGAMSPKQWEYYKGLGYEMDAMVGQSGFEMAFEEYLHGTDGLRVDEVTKDGTVVKSYYKVEPKSGNNVQVTIDLNLQMKAEDELAAKIEMLRDPEQNTGEDGLDARGGAVVALDAKTGKVLVCASYPTYDLSTLFENYDAILNQEYGPLLNRALMATYAPGSTFKVCSTIAGIESGTITMDETIKTLGKFSKYKGFSATCLRWREYGYTHGTIDCTDALMYSCNYFFYELADRMGISKLDMIAKAMGLGEHTGVELPEYIGHRSNPQTKAEIFAGTDSAGWYPADTIMTAIGQGQNRYTPMQLAVYAMTLANKGTRYSATFLNRVVSSDYRSLVYENKKEIMSTIQLSEQAIQAYFTGMQKVAHESGGTAYKIFKNYPINVCAKTGTADAGTDDVNAAFMCFAPAEDPEIVIAIYGENAGHGSAVADIAKAILDAYFEIGDSADVDSSENQVS